MRTRLLTTVPFVVALSACGASDPPTETAEPATTVALAADVPAIVASAIDFHGGALYEHSRVGMTITSLSGSFRIDTTRDGGSFEHIVTGTVGPDGVERRVRLTNEGVQEWRDGTESELDEEGERRATAFVNARVFFPLLPYTLKGGDIRFEDRGLETWDGRDLHKVKISFNPGTSNDADDGYMFWFDPESGRVEQFGYDFDTGLRFRKAVEFADVGGMVFSTQENYAIDGGRVPVEMLSPEYVAEQMELLSTVVVSDITVEPL